MRNLIIGTATDVKYSYEEIIRLMHDSKMYKLIISLGVSNGDTGEQIKAEKIKEDYIHKLNEISEDLSELGIKASKTAIKKMENSLKRIKIDNLEKKLSENIITSSEYLLLLSEKGEKLCLRPKFSEFSIINKAKVKPDGLSVVNYGRFKILSELSSYDNKIKHANGKPYSIKILLDKLELTSEISLKSCIAELKKYKMISELDNGKNKFIVINPSYISTSVDINLTIYELFKDDLDEVLTEEAKTYFSILKNENTNNFLVGYSN